MLLSKAVFAHVKMSLYTTINITFNLWWRYKSTKHINIGVTCELAAVWFIICLNIIRGKCALIIFVAMTSGDEKKNESLIFFSDHSNIWQNGTNQKY